MKNPLILLSILSVTGCFSQNDFAIEACKVAFKSTETVAVSNLNKNTPYVFEKRKKLVVGFAYSDDSFNNPDNAQCEIASPIKSGDIPMLLAMNVNGNYFSEDKVALAQSAIIDWISTEGHKSQ